ncbi:hypothetical protein, partial [Rhizobium ruizarguesonis]|uniref:hypothetical protein n=1 Tax=Rhizobium ruizarguesonis TaxID=2081791 RepID=UPI0016A5A776
PIRKNKTRRKIDGFVSGLKAGQPAFFYVGTKSRDGSRERLGTTIRAWNSNKTIDPISEMRL